MVEFDEKNSGLFTPTGSEVGGRSTISLIKQKTVMNDRGMNGVNGSSTKKDPDMILLKEYEDEFKIPCELKSFKFKGGQPVGFQLNISTHMEVSRSKNDSQAQKLGIKQGDILIKINNENISKNSEKAMKLLRSFVQNKKSFTISFVRRIVEKLVIIVKRSGNTELNGKYIFYKRISDDFDCPAFVKFDVNEFVDINEYKEQKIDALTSNNKDIHIIQRAYFDVETSESLWVIRNGKDEHFYMSLTNEYLPPQSSWDIVPDSGADYPAPGLTFETQSTKFVTKMIDDGNDEKDIVHDALNVQSGRRGNKQNHQKTLTRMRQTLGNQAAFMAHSNNKNNKSDFLGIIILCYIIYIKYIVG